MMHDILHAEGSSDEKIQEDLAKEMGFRYRNGIGELIYAMITCRPYLSYSVVCCSQYSSKPHEIHYHAVRHMLKYLYQTQIEGISYWRITPNESLPNIPPPPLLSNAHDLLLDGHPLHAAKDMHAYMDSEWATCPKTRRSVGGANLRLSGSTIAWKTKLELTVAQSSTKAEFIEAADCRKLIMFCRGILWDLGSL